MWGHHVTGSRAYSTTACIGRGPQAEAFVTSLVHVLQESLCIALSGADAQVMTTQHGKRIVQIVEKPGALQWLQVHFSNLPLVFFKLGHGLVRCDGIVKLLPDEVTE